MQKHVSYIGQQNEVIGVMFWGIGLFMFWGYLWHMGA